jgi:hypothetical protein
VLRHLVTSSWDTLEAASSATTSGRFCFLYEVTEITRPCLEQQPLMRQTMRACAMLLIPHLGKTRIIHAETADIKAFCTSASKM